jgi:predicted alpha/beta hydrolase
VVLAGATAVPRRAYGALAETLARAGLSVLTFDYRGVAGSAPRRLRGDRSTMADWGQLDLDGALGWMRDRAPDLPLLLLGHSVGGQLLGFAEQAETLRGALLVGSQSGYWRNWPGAARLRMWVHWHLVLPAVSTALGYASMSALGMGEDLPAGVARQWARWGRRPDFLLSDCTPAERERYRRLGFPIRAYHLADDTFAPRAAVEALLDFYRGARTELVSRAPAELDVPAIGHFGWLKPTFRETLWREMAAWLLSRADEVSGRVELPPLEDKGVRSGPGRGEVAAGRHSAPWAPGAAARGAR